MEAAVACRESLRFAAAEVPGEIGLPDDASAFAVDLKALVPVHAHGDRQVELSMRDQLAKPFAAHISAKFVATLKGEMGQNHVFLIRHGETEWSKSGQHTGGTDLPLTEAGREQGQLLTERLRGIEFAVVLSSPLQRAMETCRQAHLQKAAEILEDLREWDYGEYEGLTTPEIRQRQPDWSIWAHGAPHGESPEQVSERAERVLERARNADGDVALFSHGHMLRAIGARWLGLPVNAGQHLMLSTASVSVLGYERETPVIRLWNGRAHLSQFT